MKTIFFEVPESEQPVFAGLLPGGESSYLVDKLDENTVGQAADAEIVSVFINSILDKAMIDKLPNLKMIATRSTGTDHIDIEYAKSKGITVCNVPAYGSNTVAEFAFALMLNISRKAHMANEELRRSGDFSVQTFRGFDLYGKTLGVIGTGRIGRNSINIALGFGMKVLAYDLYPNADLAKEKGFEYVDLNTLLANSDVITIHAPYTKDNHHLLGHEQFALMKKGMCLVNTARGELIDTEALVWALNEGIVAGAGLDVLEGERELKEEIEILSDPQKSNHVQDYKTLFTNHVLIGMPNVVVTPHIAFYSEEAEQEIIKTTVGNIQGFLSGAPANVIK